jgi:putative phage-type endonuclease
MKIIDCEQRSPDWFAARLGKVTASHFSDVMAKGRGGGASKTREKYMMQLLAERVSGSPEESYQNKWMEEGTEKEPDGRFLYEWITGTQVGQIGFVEFSEDVGCSPDGLVGEEGLLELKCPKLTTHLSYILKDALPSEYKAQVQGQMWVCERKWCDFVSYHPDCKKQELFIHRVERDDAYITLLAAATATFLTELTELQKRLEK